MNYLCIIKVKELLFNSNTIYRKMVHINPNMPNFNVNQWHIVVQEHKDITHFEGVGPTESVQRIVTRIVHVDRLSELLIRAVNNRTRERNYFKKLVEFFQDEITEEEFDKEIRNQAIMSAKRLAVIRAIAEAEKITVSEDEYKEALNNYYENSGAKDSMELSAYEEQVGKGNIMDLLLNDKVGAFLIENGKEASK